MHSSTGSVIFILALFLLLSASTSQFYNCSEAFLQVKEKKNITFCKKLTTLGAEFGWNYDDHNESRIDILFGMKVEEEMRWLAWGVNPSDRPQMVGTRAIIGIKQPNGSSVIKTYRIIAETKLGCRLEPSKIDVTVRNLAFECMSAYCTIYATLFLPSLYNISRLNHVWQIGYDADDFEPKKHPTNLQNVDSTERLNLKNKQSIGVGKHRRHLRTVHGILNIVGWGTFLPIGVIAVRYFRVHPWELTWWFQLHVYCQIIGYILGTIGWIIGLLLGRASRHYSFGTHRILAIFIFTFTTLQVLALRLKPKKKDEYRKFWNMYHHFLGYALLAVISVNIFHGIAILKPDQIWKLAYIGLLGIFAVIALAFEIYSWSKFLADRKGKAKSTRQSNLTRGN